MERTFALLLMIGVGLFLQKKVSSSEHLKGLKVLILSVALPATIFVALISAELSQTLLFLPLMALSFNGVMLLATYYVGNLFPQLSTGQHKSIMMLLPSLAPGLSCFPFISEYLGSESVAMAAIADVGNKFFVLILLYMLAMKWYNQQATEAEGSNRMKKLFLALVNEPINVVIVIALVMLAFGWNLQSLPGVIGDVVTRFSGMMAPLILLFIGMAVKISKGEVGMILQLLTWRAGLFLILSAGIIWAIPTLSPSLMLLAIVFPQSACSFWPFAHMSTINGMEEGRAKTFDINFALSILAISLPFSTLVIVGVLSFPAVFVNPIVLVLSGVLLMLAGLVPQLKMKSRKLPEIQEKLETV